jgi:cellobiose-specific phosphotransferase system component IIA
VSGLDRAVWDARMQATKALCALPDGDARDEMANAIDGLNKAHDALTDALVRQRDGRGAEVLRLLDRLAEEKGKVSRG